MQILFIWRVYLYRAHYNILHILFNRLSSSNLVNNTILNNTKINATKCNFYCIYRILYPDTPVTRKPFQCMAMNTERAVVSFQLSRSGSRDITKQLTLHLQQRYLAQASFQLKSLTLLRQARCKHHLDYEIPAKCKRRQWSVNKLWSSV